MIGAVHRETANPPMAKHPTASTARHTGERILPETRAMVRRPYPAPAVGPIITTGDRHP